MRSYVSISIRQRSGQSRELIEVVSTSTYFVDGFGISKREYRVVSAFPAMGPVIAPGRVMCEPERRKIAEFIIILYRGNP